MIRKHFFSGILILLVAVIQPSVTTAQNIIHNGAEIQGGMSDKVSSARIKEYTVEILRNGEAHGTATRKRDQYSMYLEAGAIYTIIYKAEGYWNKVMEINLTGHETCVGLYKMDIDGVLTPKRGGADFSALQNEPVAKASFNEECQLSFDSKYSEEMQKKWQSGEK